MSNRKNDIKHYRHSPSIEHFIALANQLPHHEVLPPPGSETIELQREVHNVFQKNKDYRDAYDPEIFTRRSFRGNRYNFFYAIRTSLEAVTALGQNLPQCMPERITKEEEYRPEIYPGGKLINWKKIVYPEVKFKPTQGKAFTIKGFLAREYTYFLNALGRMSLSSIRLCPICRTIFRAKRKDQPACSKLCANNYRVRKYREAKP